MPCIVRIRCRGDKDELASVIFAVPGNTFNLNNIVHLLSIIRKVDDVKITCSAEMKFTYRGEEEI